MQNSGKLLIVAILAVALLLAGASWWFRYEATRQAAQFWGPAAVRLIRDAPNVAIGKIATTGGESDAMNAPLTSRDISQAHGLTHLRNALLEDRSFNWTKSIDAQRSNYYDGGWSLSFSDHVTGEHLKILFPADCRAAAFDTDGRELRVISTEPIAAGLVQVFTEVSSEKRQSER